MEEHKRRKRYSGTHPRRFEEKYKELDPEKYKSDVEKIISQGKTPAGTHRPIMVAEVLEALDVRPGMVGLDATLGYGGHSGKILERLEGRGHLYALDVDSIEIEKTKARLNARGFGDDILTVLHMNFADIDRAAPKEGFDFVMADLGVSSMQIDDPERGFSYKLDGPLDLRLDPSSGVTAAERLTELDEEELAAMLLENSDEPYASRIAAEIIKTLDREEIKTTRQLASAIERALSFIPQSERRQEVKKACQRVFQAIRIDVNSEFEVLYTFLEKLPAVLKSGGRAAVLTFHSGEDRLVKKAFKQYWREGVYSEISDGVIRPSSEECYSNPRARSTKLRWAVKA